MFKKFKRKFLMFLIVCALSIFSFMLIYYSEITYRENKVINDVVISLIHNVIENMRNRRKIPYYKLIPSYPSIAIPPNYDRLIKIKKRINNLIDNRKVVIVVKSGRYSLSLPDKIDGYKIFQVRSFDKILDEKWRWIEENKSIGKDSLGYYDLQYIYFTKKPYLLMEVKDVIFFKGGCVVSVFFNTGIDDVTYLVRIYMIKSSGRWIVGRTKIRYLSKF